MLLYVLSTLLVATLCKSFEEEKSKCEPIKSDLCRFLSANGYNQTNFPNMHNHRRQSDAVAQLNQLQPLLNRKCAEELPLFVCSTYLPFCIEHSEEILKPCRFLCIASKNGCEEIMTRFGYMWPFDCDLYPDETKGEMCFGANQTHPIATLSPSVISKTKTKGKKRKMKGKVSGKVGEDLKIKCPKEHVIEIRKVIHKNSMCCPQASKTVLAAICHKKSTCVFTNERRTFGGHCLNSVGDVSIKYKCVREEQQTSIC